MGSVPPLTFILPRKAGPSATGQSAGDALEDCAFQREIKETDKKFIVQRGKLDKVLIIYGLKNCDTCRKALKALPEAGLKDVRKDGVPDDLLQRALETFGQALVNTRSTTWRGLDEAARKRAPLELLQEHPSLMKRPLIVSGDALFLSWNKDIEAQVKASL